MKTILEIDLSTASFPVGTALLKFCADHSLSYSLHGGETVAPRMMPAEKAHVAAAPKAATPRRKGRPAKRTKAPVAPATPKAKPAKRVAKPAAKPSEMERATRSLPDWKANRPKAPPPADSDEETPPPERDRTIAVSPEERAKVNAILRDLDKGDGVMTEAVYSAWGGKDRHKQLVIYSLRANGTIRDNGGSKRGLRLYAPKETAEHPSTGQTLTKKPRARVTARDKATRVERVVVSDGDVSPVESAE